MGGDTRGSKTNYEMNYMYQCNTYRKKQDTEERVCGETGRRNWGNVGGCDRVV